jgi:hypothetical protein
VNSSGGPYGNTPVPADANTDVSVAIASKDLSAGGAQSFQDDPVGVPKTVWIADTDEGYLRPGDAKEVARSRGPASMVTHLEHGESRHSGEDPPLDLSGGIAGEEDGGIPPTNQDHDGEIVEVHELRRLGRLRVGMQDFDLEAIDDEGSSFSRGPPPTPLGFGGLEDREIGPRPRWDGGIEDSSDGDSFQDTKYAADMVEVRVREDECLDFFHAFPPQVRHDSPRTGIEPAAAGTRVHEQPTTAGRPKSDRISLTHVDQVDF